MRKRGDPRADERQVSASELAQMGVCERLMVFEQRHGKRLTLAQRKAIQRGLRTHRWFYRDRHRDIAANGHCVIATQVTTRACHRVASALYGWLMHWSAVRPPVRAVLRPIRWCIALWSKAVGRGDGI
ncbi:hypothetical protein GALL_258680 [mine drainage metagenome]|uniref:Uncharacterized protein n=1 Tax=mine drainage metagenome TaxID=410659 RepID=A0A1J5RJN2_9ZZZZ